MGMASSCDRAVAEMFIWGTPSLSLIPSQSSHYKQQLVMWEGLVGGGTIMGAGLGDTRPAWDDDLSVGDKRM